MEMWLPLALDDLGQRLLDKSVRHRGNAKESGTTVRLWDFYAPYRFGAVSALHQLCADSGPVRFEVGTEFIHSHAIDARCAFVALDLCQGPFEILFVQNLCHQG